jgi:hypothetical protein
MRKWCFVLGVIIYVVGSMAGQYVVLDKDVTWQGGTGAAYQQYSGPLDWSQGLLYRRYQILSKPTSLKMGIDQCVWSGGETCSPCPPYFTEPGDYYIKDNPGSWWKQAAPLTGWGVHGQRANILTDQNCNLWISTCGNPWCTGQSVAGDLPVSTHITEIYVDPGTTFECPSDWVGPPDEDWGCSTTRSVVPKHEPRQPANVGIAVESVMPHQIDLRLAGPGRVSVYSPNGDRLATAVAGSSGRVRLSGASIVPGVLLLKTEGTHAGASKVCVP